MNRHSARPPAGFTLLEVLIALVIAGIAIAALLRGGGAGLAATDTAARYEDAVSRAQSRLADATRGGVLTARDNQGDDGRGFHWRVRVTPVASTMIRQPGPGVRSSMPATLYQVSVWVSWGDGMGERLVDLETEQVGGEGR